MTDIKEHILTTSTELFLDLGFKSVTMDEIAAQLGMSKKTLYSHYSTKEALVEEAFLHIYNNVCSGIDCIVNESINPIEELYDVKKWVMTSLKGDKTSPIHQMQKFYPRVYSKISKMQFEFMQNCITKNITQGIKMGLYRDTLDINFVSRVYFVGIQGIKDLHLFPTDLFPVNALYDQYLEYHLRGIVTPAGRNILNRLINSNHD
jgi:AcrR family transcriptional regulator